METTDYVGVGLPFSGNRCFREIRRAAMDGKKVPPPSRIPKKKSQPGEKKCTSGERPQVTGSDSEISVTVPSSSQVNVSPAGVKGDNAKVWQRVEEIEAKQLDFTTKQQLMDERIAKLEGNGHQDVPSQAKPKEDSAEQSDVKLFTSSKPKEPSDKQSEGQDTSIKASSSQLPTAVTNDKDEKMVATLSKMQESLTETAKLVQGMQEREDQRRQAAADEATLMKNMLKQQEEMQREQKDHRERIKANTENIEKLKTQVDRMSSTSSANSSVSASSPGMEVGKEAGGSVSDKDKLSFPVQASQSDPGPQKQHSLESKQKESASAGEPLVETTVLMKLEKLEATQVKILDAVQRKEQVASSSGPNESSEADQPQEETAAVKPGTSKSAPPHLPLRRHPS